MLIQQLLARWTPWESSLVAHLPCLSLSVPLPVRLGILNTLGSNTAENAVSSTLRAHLTNDVTRLTMIDCGNALLNGGGPAPDGSDNCDMACNGNQTEWCGGPNRLNLYQIDVPPPTGWQAQGCYTDAVGARTLASVGIIAGGPM
jgi:hypothetical protein